MSVEWIHVPFSRELLIQEQHILRIGGRCAATFTLTSRRDGNKAVHAVIVGRDCEVVTGDMYFQEDDPVAAVEYARRWVMKKWEEENGEIS